MKSGPRSFLVRLYGGHLICEATGAAVMLLSRLCGGQPPEKSMNLPNKAEPIGIHEANKAGRNAA